MRLSRRLTGVLLVLAVAGALAPGALAKRNPPPGSTSPPPAAYMVDIEALR